MFSSIAIYPLTHPLENDLITDSDMVKYFYFYEFDLT